MPDIDINFAPSPHISVNFGGEITPIPGPPGPKGDPGESAYQIAVDNGFVGTEQEWLGSLHGADGKDGVDGANGVDGTDGADGETPYIGENGNWWIGETDTGVQAQGEDGLPALVYTAILEGSTNFSVGYSTSVPRNNFNRTPVANEVLPINTRNTLTGNTFLILARITSVPPVGTIPVIVTANVATRGVAGVAGSTPYIGENGNWWISGEDTGTKAEGEDGADGHTPEKGVDYWTDSDKQEIVDDVLAALPVDTSLLARLDGGV